MKKVLPIFLALLFLLFSSKHSDASFRHQILNEVLGDATVSALPQLPPTSEGPGLILPDSPFYFLDQLKQDVRLLLAFSPEDKAKLRTEIAGERLAELRFMLARNNQRAAEKALDGVSENLRQAALQLSKAQFEGKDVRKLAQDVNSDIKLKQKALDTLETSSTGSFELSLKKAQESIFESKVQVEDSLPEGEIENEVKNDLARRLQRRIENASDSAKLLEKDINDLAKEASESAAKSLEKRQEALKKAIESRNEALKKVQERLLENEKKRQEKLLEAQKKAAEEAKEALRNAQTAASGIEKAQEVVNELRTSSSGENSGRGQGGGKD